MCLSGHTLAITCVKWGGDGVIYTGYFFSLYFLLVSMKFSLVLFVLIVIIYIFLHTPVRLEYKLMFKFSFYDF